MDILLLGTNHALMCDEPPELCPTNKEGELQKFMNNLWIDQLMQKFNPAAVFDESFIAMASFGMVHENIDYFRPTYRPLLPWVFMDVPMHRVQASVLRRMPYTADAEYRDTLREEYWLKIILWISNVMNVQRIAVICGFLHVQTGNFEKLLRAHGIVEVHNVTNELWYSMEWAKLPHDQSIVDGWMEEHRKKNIRLERDRSYK